MALIFTDGFDDYSDITDRWPSSYHLIDFNFGIAAGIGRFGTDGFKLSRAGSYIRRSVGSLDQLAAGTAYCLTNGIGVSRLRLLVVWGTNDDTLYKCFCVGISANHRIYVSYFTKNGTEVIGAYASKPARSKAYDYIEVRADDINPLGANVDVLFNGRSIISTSMPTSPPDFTIGEGYIVAADHISIGPSGSYLDGYGGAVYFDDLYVTDGAFIGDECCGDSSKGDMRIETLYPASDGYHQDWIPCVGSDHYSMVDEHPHDGDETYVSSENSGDKDSYVFDTPSADLGDVLFASLNITAKASEAGAFNIHALGRAGGADVTGDPDSLTEDYVVYANHYAKALDASDWDASKLAATEFGVEIST